MSLPLPTLPDFSGLQNSINSLQTTVNTIGSTVTKIDSTISNVNKLLLMVFSYLNPGTTKDAVEHLIAILKTLVYIITIFSASIVTFIISGALKVLLPMRYTIFFITLLLSVVGIFMGLLLLAQLYVLNALDKSGQDLITSVTQNVGNIQLQQF